MKEQQSQGVLQHHPCAMLPQLQVSLTWGAFSRGAQGPTAVFGCHRYLLVTTVKRNIPLKQLLDIGWLKKQCDISRHLPAHPPTSTAPQTPKGPQQPRKHLKTLLNTATPSQHSPGHHLGLPASPPAPTPLHGCTKSNTGTGLASKGGMSSASSSPRLQVLGD